MIVALVRFWSALGDVLILVEVADFAEEIVLLVVLTGELLFATGADALHEILSAL